MSCEFIADLFFTFASIGVEVFFFLDSLTSRTSCTSFTREAGGFQFLDTLESVGGQSLALGLVALDGDELFGIDLLLASEGVSTSVGELDAWVDGIRQEDEL